MIRCAGFALVMAIVLGPSCAHRPRTYPYAWHLRGAVVSSSDCLIQVRHKTGRIIDLRIDDHTSFYKNEQTSSWQAVHQGSRIAVDVQTVQAGVYRARLVRIFGATAQ